MAVDTLWRIAHGCVNKLEIGSQRTMANAFGCQSLKNVEKKRHAVAKREGRTYVDEAQIVFIKISVSEIRY
jgi:hypothetical protein